MRGEPELINPPALGKHSGYSHGVKVPAGSLLFIAGQVGWDEQGKIVSPDFAEQFSRALDNVLTVLFAAGGKAENLARLTIYLLDRNEYQASLQEIGKIYRAKMGKHYPAMTAVEVRGLVEEGARVELEATAWL